MIFSRCLSQGTYIFPWGEFAQLPFSGWKNEISFYRYHFFREIELSKIQFQEIYELDNNSFQGTLIFKNLVVHAPVWVKNGIAHWPEMG